MLVLDEPTNDLDLETLELLEELLLEYQGTLLVVSHDRAFLDNVVTATLVCDSPGEWNEYAGGYEDWLRQRKAAEPPPPPKPAKAAPVERVVVRARRPSFKEKRELEELPGRIETLEAEKQALIDRMVAPDYHTLRGDEVARLKQRMAELDAELETVYARWLELEALVTGEAE